MAILFYNLPGKMAFIGCHSLNEIVIPKSVNNIGEKAFGYYNIGGFYGQKIEDFTIYGYTGSAAEIYANDNGFEFIDVESIPETPTDIETPKDNETLTDIETTQPTTTTTTTTTAEPTTTTTVPTTTEPTTTTTVPTTTEPTTTTTVPTTTEPTTTATQPTSSTTMSTTSAVIKGDCNSDGKVSVADARKIVVAIAKNDTDGLLESCDVNNDGKISVADARKIVVAIAKNDYNF